jgi:hypothetical protein
VMNDDDDDDDDDDVLRSGEPATMIFPMWDSRKCDG